MKVLVNDTEVELGATDSTTVSELLDGLREGGHIPDDQVVTGLTFGGEPWGSEELELRLDAPVGEVDEVAVRTDGLDGYARRMLTDAAGMLRVLREAALKVARQFRSDTPQSANADLFNLLDSLQQFLSFLCQIRNTCLPEGQEEALSGGSSERLAAALDDVCACQQAEDWSGLADSLEAKLAPALEGLAQDVAALEARV